jgi:hypothetical protein
VRRAHSRSHCAGLLLSPSLSPWATAGTL